MPKLSKVQKKVAKKRGNKSNTLNEDSRDAQKLRRSGARNEKLERLAAARAKANQPHRTKMPSTSRGGVDFDSRSATDFLVPRSSKSNYRPY